MPTTTKSDKATLRDAQRYRFLREKTSRDHKHHSRTAMTVGIVGWPADMGDPKTTQLWSRMDLDGPALDAAVDRHMRRKP